jgi:hypothetical protein
MEKKAKDKSASPLKSVEEELVFLRKMFSELIGAYSLRLEAEILRITESVVAEGKKKISTSRARDARDMLVLLRNLGIKPEKGRRRDLKKIDSALEELRYIADRW